MPTRIMLGPRGPGVLADVGDTLVELVEELLERGTTFVAEVREQYGGLIHGALVAKKIIQVYVEGNIGPLDFLQSFPGGFDAPVGQFAVDFLEWIGKGIFVSDWGTLITISPRYGPDP